MNNFAIAPSAGVPCQPKGSSVQYLPQYLRFKARTHLHLGLQLVLQNPTEFLNVMLHERVRALPPETLRQLRRPYGLIRALQMVKDSLKRERKGFRRGIIFRWDLVDGSTEVRGTEEGLEQRVHVASSTLVLQSNETGFLFRVVAGRAKIRSVVLN
jgi:hypothetical protein